MSILRFPERGPWGDPKWPGNCSGHVYKGLFEQLKPKTALDLFSGSGTAQQVAAELGIDCVSLDLKDGFNVLRHSVLEAVGHEVDLSLQHPPYHDILVYSGRVWGEAHPDDLSRCCDEDEFLEKLEFSLFNQREATKSGGHYVCIIGDRRKAGKYSSYQAEVIARMPKSELRSVLIKQQFNTASARKSYGAMRYSPILHEYVLVFERGCATTFALLGPLARQHARRLRSTWRQIVRLALVSLGGEASLTRLYEKIFETSDRTRGNPNWAAKVRQTVRSYPQDFKPVERGVYALA